MSLAAVNVNQQTHTHTHTNKTAMSLKAFIRQCLSVMWHQVSSKASPERISHMQQYGLTVKGMPVEEFLANAFKEMEVAIL